MKTSGADGFHSAAAGYLKTRSATQVARSPFTLYIYISFLVLFQEKAASPGGPARGYQQVSSRTGTGIYASLESNSN